MQLTILAHTRSRVSGRLRGAHNSGEASAIQEVDLNGLVSGNALAFTWSNEFRPLSWGTLTVTGAGLPSTGLNFYTYDGIYEAYLPITIGRLVVSFTLSISTHLATLHKLGRAQSPVAKPGLGKTCTWNKPTCLYPSSAPSPYQQFQL